jgi:2-iminobutanoate/2-iminopropanoate deaminase
MAIYMTDMSNFKDVNEAYAAYFETDPPARTAIGVAALPLGAEVEIDAILATRD